MDCEEIASYTLKTRLAKSFHKNYVTQATLRLGNAGFQPRTPLYGQVQNPKIIFGGSIEDIHHSYEECNIEQVIPEVIPTENVIQPLEPVQPLDDMGKLSEL